MLFTPEFIRSIEQLRLIARQVPAGGRHADQLARVSGAGMEFRDYRGYMPGDDIRRVDWNLYRRSGRLFTRIFDETRDLPVHILLDSSDSMYFEDPPRADAARRVAAAFTAISLNQNDRPAIYPFGADLAEPLRALAGKQSLPGALAYLSALKPAGSTNLARSLRRFSCLGARVGVAVVISDFFDPGGAPAVIEALTSLRERLVLIQLVRAGDADPGGEGELRLVDCESNTRVDATVTRRALERYRQAYETFNSRLAEFAARRGAVLFRFDADGDVLAQLSTLFAGGTLRM